MSPAYRLIVGLGNPGAKYSLTRHNVGFGAVDEFAKKSGISVSKDAHMSVVGTDPAEGLILAKPQTFMNRSGFAVAALCSFYKISPEDMVVIHDDLDLPEGTVRIKVGGGTGGHRGLESIVEQTASADFTRIRIGIGREEGIDPSDYVLSPLDPDTFDLLARAGCDALELLLDKGVQAAMNVLHAPREAEGEKQRREVSDDV